MSSPQISVIVPFYNVVDCVVYCLEGLLAQTYEDYEIVCVDDGSIDGTGALLDEYASKDSRICTYHRENGGAAAARNYGVACSRGEYLTFVDGDDLVSPYYLETLVRSMGDRRGRMVVGTHRRLAHARIVEDRPIAWEVPNEAREVTKKELMEAMAYEEVLPSACMRLAGREVYVENPFPTGDYYEDVATASIFANNCTSFAMVDTPIYGYVMKPGSVVHKKRADIGQVSDYKKAIDSFIDAACGTISEDEGIRHFRSLELIRLYRLLDRVEEAKSEQLELRKEIIRRVKADSRKNIKDGRTRSLNKMRVLLMSVSPRLLMVLSDLYDDRIKKVQYR